MNSQLLQRNTYEDQVGQNIAARLSTATDHLPHDISERLKAARMQALAKRKIAPKLQTAAATVVQDGVVTLQMGSDDRSLWNRIGSLLPLLALVAGMITIAVIAEDKRVNELAEIDTELLTDELPPDAYTDPGFAQFLRMKSRD
ncbi:MAG: hypothetical protein A3F78_01545 [Burkholderiales bacterium RIFCSPLOWO2_12_FULL_61_40]|nr:MAG: hypothetical protein A3F78_01545 [Burkholderiales bacterium RIFCSPLOWO2_12_FULL_61_40]